MCTVKMGEPSSPSFGMKMPKIFVKYLKFHHRNDERRRVFVMFWLTLIFVGYNLMSLDQILLDSTSMLAWSSGNWQQKFPKISDLKATTKKRHPKNLLKTSSCSDPTPNSTSFPPLNMWGMFSPEPSPKLPKTTTVPPKAPRMTSWDAMVTIPVILHSFKL